MDEEITRAASTSASGRKTTSSSTAKKKTSSTSTAKKKTSTTSAAKKKTGTTAAAKKKTTSSSSIRLSAAEKKLVTNYRKCGTLQKQIISLVVEKVAGGVTKLEGLERLVQSDDQSGVL